MEAYTTAALSGIGYTLSKERQTFKNIENQPLPQNDIPSMKNLYDSDYWNQVRKQEFQMGTESWNQAQTPTTTGVVPRPAYADMFKPLMPEGAASGFNMENAGGNKQTYVESMTGDSIPSEQFKHNNMQPFFRGEVKQNIDPFASSSYLENSTGRGERFKHKQEVECFFEPIANMGNVCGMKNNVDYYVSHIEAPIKRNNDFPIEQVRVGPGLNMGFNNNSEGGFQQARTLDYARPKTVDELRPLSRPKSTYELPFQGPQKTQTGGSRGLEGTMVKNRPDTFYEQSEDQWLKTTGANTRETERPEFVIKPTARVDGHVEYQGAAAAFGAQPGKGAEDDYGKAGVLVYSNARDVTQKRTVISNLTSMVKAVVAPFTDILKRTPKEYFVDAPRTFGNMHAQIPSKPTTYDPITHAMRTTIKETTIHDATILNAKGPDGVPVQSEDEARTTNRQTLESFETTRNVNAHVYKAFVYDPEVVARTTNRQTVSDNNNQHGYVGGDVTGRKGAYSHIEVQVYDTQKQFVSDNDHYGHAGSGAHRDPMSYEAEYNAEIDGTREMMNIKSGNTPGAGGAYTGLTKDAVDMEVKKINSDYMSSRENNNVTKVYQPSVKPIEQCEVTKTPQGACLVEQTNRLDPSLMTNLRNNPYNLSVNPI